ncbi:LLM class flavin-dependent oxidoreductase [Cupriavidus sp. PET2-C1]
MPKEIRINAFVTFAPSHLSPGLWKHPRDKSLQYNTLSYWTELARIAERGLYDALFWADGISTYSVYGGSHAPAIRGALQFPRLDPLLLVSAMAQVTTHLGLAVTSSTTYEPPYQFARRMSTLDHLTNGRVGWNIVTSFGSTGTKAVGLGNSRGHDERYDVADEYMELLYKLWEGSWEDDAAVRDSEAQVFADPDKVHDIHHDGKYFQMEGVHYSEPSPQRTPLLYQAGASGRGKDFAATHAECVFISAPSKKVIRDTVDETRRRVAEQGRDPASVLFFMLLTVIVGRTEEEARAKLADIEQHVSLEGALALFSRWTGVDLAGRDIGEPFSYEKSEAMQSTIEGFTIGDPDRAWTIGELARHNAIGGKGPVIVGSPEQVADAMQAWIEETGVDGFNLSYTIMPDSHTDFVDLVVPELQRRGVYKTAYQPGTLREKLYGPGRARVGDDHAAAQYRVWGQRNAEPTAATAEAIADPAAVSVAL